MEASAPAEDPLPQRVADALAQGDVPIKPEYILSKPPAPQAAARPQPAPQASSSGDHYDSREAAAARAAAPPAERALELTLTTEDESLFSGERCLSITVAKARQLCRAIEQELARLAGSDRVRVNARASFAMMLPWSCRWKLGWTSVWSSPR